MLEHHNQPNATLQILMTRFFGRVLIPFSEATAAIGMGVKTARNRLALGTYPVRTVLVGARRFVHINDLAEYLDSLREPPKPGRGRPSKSRKLGELQ